MALAIGGLGLLLSWLPWLAWPAEVLGNFVVQAVLGGVVVAVVFGVRERWIRAGIALLLVGIWAVPWLSRSGVDAPKAAVGRSFTVSLHNVLRTNPTPARVIDEARQWDPHLAIFEEVSDAWAAPLDGLSDRFPHAVFVPAEHNFGIAARSRLPFATSDVRYLCGPPAQTLPALDLAVDTELGRLRVVAVHFVPPVGATAAAVRDEQISALIDILKDPAPRTVLVGDLNTTVFAATYRRLLRGTGLVDVRNGRGLLPTWPAGMPELLRLSLDHVLVSPELAARSVHVGDPTGSDHRGVRVELGLRQ